jgi:hypothetical protein
MTWRRVLPLLIAAVATAAAGCAHPVAGTATWPGARLEKALLTPADLPPAVQYDRIQRDSNQPDGQSGLPAMESRPEGCSDTLTRVIANSAERGPGSAAEYLVSYDGARMVMTVLTSPLHLDKLAAAADRCERFDAFFDPASPGIPMTTTRLATERTDALAYEQTMTLNGMDNSVYFSFENVAGMGVFGVAFPTPNPAIGIKGSLPQTFLDIAAKQAARILET